MDILQERARAQRLAEIAGISNSWEGADKAARAAAKAADAEAKAADAEARRIEIEERERHEREEVETFKNAVTEYKFNLARLKDVSERRSIKEREIVDLGDAAHQRQRLQAYLRSGWGMDWRLENQFSFDPNRGPIQGSRVPPGFTADQVSRVKRFEQLQGERVAIIGEQENYGNQLGRIEQIFPALRDLRDAEGL